MQKSVSSPAYAQFCDFLIAARQSAGLSQARVAQSLDKPQSFVAKYEQAERRLDVVEFVVIARVLGIDPCGALRQIEEALEKGEQSGETRKS